MSKMSGGSLPFPMHDSSSSTSSTHDHHDNPFSSSYPTGTSSFHMNPLSPHPPRTPRSSVTTRAHVTYSTEVYGGSDRRSGVYGEEPPHHSPEKTLSHVDNDVDERGVLMDDELGDESKSNVSQAEVWREVLKTSIGRDKAFKVIQYSLRVYLLSHGALTASRLFAKASRPLWESELVKRLDSTVSGLSLTRKCLILFSWLTPLTSILASETESMDYTQKSSTPGKSRPLLHTFLHAPPPVLLELVNGISDDIYAFFRLGLLSRKVGERAGRFSDWCCFAGALVALVELNFERDVTTDKIQAAESRLYAVSMTGATSQSTAPDTKHAEVELDQLRRQGFWLRMQGLKLIMDLIFYSWECFRVKRAREFVKTFAGIASALLSVSKLYYGHRSALLIKASR